MNQDSRWPHKPERKHGRLIDEWKEAYPEEYAAYSNELKRRRDEYKKAWTAQHRKEISARLAARKASDPAFHEREKERLRKWHADHRDEANAASRKRYYDNHEKNIEYHRKRYRENRERILASQRKYYFENRDEILRRSGERRERLREAIAARDRSYRERIRAAMASVVGIEETVAAVLSFIRTDAFRVEERVRAEGMRSFPASDAIAFIAPSVPALAGLDADVAAAVVSTARKRRWKEDNYARIAEAARKRYYAVPAEERARIRHDYYAANRDEILKRCREYEARNADRIREYRRKYREEHREELQAYWQAFYSAKRAVSLEEAKRREREFMARGEKLEAEIASRRERFSYIEDIMLMPPEDRWQFAKDWTPEERAYAASLEYTVSGSGDDGIVLSADEIESGISEADLEKFAEAF